MATAVHVKSILANKAIKAIFDTLTVFIIHSKYFPVLIG